MWDSRYGQRALIVQPRAVSDIDAGLNLRWKRSLSIGLRTDLRVQRLLAVV